MIMEIWSCFGVLLWQLWPEASKIQSYEWAIISEFHPSEVNTVKSGSKTLV